MKKSNFSQSEKIAKKVLFCWEFIGKLGFSVLVLRIWVPESPRWSLIHGYDKKAEETITMIEEKIQRKLPVGESLPEPQGPPVIIYQK